MKKRHIFISCVLVFLLVLSASVVVDAETNNYSYIDRQVAGYPGDYLPLQVVASELAELGRNDLEKVRAIYIWISTNIDYDYTYTNYYAEETFRDRKGVCNGFATLFKEMCDVAGLQAKVVSGYAKGVSYQTGKTTPESNHAWNAIYLEGKWHHIETTWASCTKEFDYYFMTNPEQFIFTHLPLNESYNQYTASWDYAVNQPAQLLQTPVDFGMWDKLPNIYARDMVENQQYYTLSNFRNSQASETLAMDPTREEVHARNFNKDQSSGNVQKDVRINPEPADNIESNTAPFDNRAYNIDNRPVLDGEHIAFLQSFNEFMNSPEFKALQNKIEIETEEAFARFKVYYESGDMEADADALMKDVENWWKSESVQSMKEATKTAIKTGLQNLVNWLEE